MKIIGHRGAAALRPENTLASFYHAWDIGADGIELDVRLSSDGEVVVFHDANGERLAGVPEEIASTPFCRMAEWRVHGEPVPLLADVLAASPAHSLILMEIKTGRDIFSRLSSILNSQCKRPVGILAFDPEIAVEAAKLFSTCPVLINLEAPEAAHMERWCAFAAKHALAGLSLGWSDAIDQRTIQLVHQHGLLFAVWTVNDPAAVRTALSWGVDILMTDDPGAMILQVHRG